MIHAQADLRATLAASLFLEGAKVAIERARTSRKESDLDRAAKFLNSEQHDALPDSEQRHLALLYAEAAFACYGGFN
jgi:hypothetical protein